MDVEILKKINSLAKTLHQQGLASNMDDATKLASCMVGTKHNEINDFSELAKTQMFDHKVESPERNTLASGEMVVNPPRTFAEVKHATINQQMMSGMQHAVPEYSKPMNPPMQPMAEEFNKIKFDIEGKINNISTKVFEVETHSQNNFKFINQIGDEIDKINNKLNRIEKALSELGNSNNVRTPNTNNSQENVSTSNAEPKVEQQSNPRTGNNNPTDFDIRKYFYSGSDK